MIEALENIEISSITAKGDISTAINKFGELYTWGSVRNGALLTANGDVYQRNLEEPTIFESAEHAFKQVSVGKDHCAMLTDKGRVMTMGSAGQHGKLGHEPVAKEIVTNRQR